MQFRAFRTLDMATVRLPSLSGLPPTLSAIVLSSGAAAALTREMADWPDDRRQRWDRALLDLVYDSPFGKWASRVQAEHPELATAVEIIEQYRLPTLGMVFDAADLALMQHITEALH